MFGHIDRVLPANADGSPHAEIARDEAWRRKRVSVAAFYLAQSRGFAPGNDLSDWTLAESQIDAIDEFEC